MVEKLVDLFFPSLSSRDTYQIRQECPANVQRGLSREISPFGVKWKKAKEENINIFFFS